MNSCDVKVVTLHIVFFRSLFQIQQKGGFVQYKPRNPQINHHEKTALVNVFYLRYHEIRLFKTISYLCNVALS